MWEVVQKGKRFYIERIVISKISGKRKKETIDDPLDHEPKGWMRRGEAAKYCDTLNKAT